MTFVLASADGQSVPPTFERPVAAAQAFSKGAVMQIDANGAYVECAADPASIYGISASAYGPDTSGYNILAAKGYPPGRMQVIKAKGQLFHAEYVGSLPAADGGAYGIVRGADGQWRVDFTDTTATRVVLVGRFAVDPRVTSPNRVLVRFRDANLQDL